VECTGFSLAAATAIIGVTLLIGMEIIMGTTIPTLTDVHDSFNDMRNRAIDQVQTDINITNLGIEVNGSDYDINVTVENTGSITLETAYFNILINGTEATFTCSKSFLYPENEVYFNVSNLQGTGIRTLKVVTNNGVSEYYEFNLP
jgi:flagellar protein FlaF